jgi:AdoMet-dependent heme synthase
MPGTIALPKWIAWEITGRCNLNCIHCRSSSGMDSDSGDLSTGQLIRLLDDIADYASPVLVLSGGEPLLREDWFQLARHGTDKGIRVCLATNGSLVDEKVCRQMLAAEIRMVSLSLDGSTPEIHDDFRRQPGAYRAVMQAVEFLQRFEIPYLINSSFTKRNQSDIPNVYRLAKELKATAWYMFMIVPTGRGEGAADELISSEDYEKILNWHYDQEIQEDAILMRPTCAPHYFRIVRERSRGMGRVWKPRSLGFATGVSKGCLAGQHIAFIDRFGRVKPCSYLPESAGSLREKSFREIWEESPLFRSLRDFGSYQGKCGVCEYVHVCGGCRARASALNQGNILAEEPFCAHVPRRPRPEGEEQGARNG